MIYVLAYAFRKEMVMKTTTLLTNYRSQMHSNSTYCKIFYPKCYTINAGRHHFKRECLCGLLSLCTRYRNIYCYWTLNKI